MLEQLEEQEEREIQRVRNSVTDREVRNMAQRQIESVLRNKFFPALHPEMGDHRKLSKISEFVVEDLGLRDPDLAVLAVAQMVGGGSQRMQPIDRAFHVVMSERAKRTLR